MMIYSHRWMAIALCTMAASAAFCAESTYQSKNLNPFHKQKLQQEIQECAARVLACSDDDSRCQQQQELCKTLIKAEDYDKALKVAESVYRTRNANPERRAAHHFLIAEIYAQKMQASPNQVLMEQNRQNALRAAQNVISQNYSDKWGINTAAKGLLKDLQDPVHIGQVRQWVEKRQSHGVDVNKTKLAEGQLAYMERAARIPVAAGAGGLKAIKRTGSAIFGSLGKGRQARDSAQVAVAASAAPADARATADSRTRPGNDGMRSFKIPDAGTVTMSRASNNRLFADPNTAMANAAASVKQRPAIVIDGPIIRRGSPVTAAGFDHPGSPARLASKLQASQVAQGTNSAFKPGNYTPGTTYAAGQLPKAGRVTPQ